MVSEMIIVLSVFGLLGVIAEIVWFNKDLFGPGE
jgi:hypothetical protein